MKNLIEALCQGGVFFFEHRHDANCPALHGHPERCNCVPDVYVHNDEKRGIATLTQNARERKAADAAEAATKKAAK